MTEQQQTIDLIKRMKNGDEQAFSLLVLQFEPLLEATARRFCKPPAYGESDFEDLRQEAVLALFKAATSFDEGQEQVTFGLYAKICINNRLISAKRHRLRSMKKDGRGVGRPRKAAPTAKKEGAMRSLPSDSQLQAYLDRARDELTPKEERVFDLYLKGLSYKEMGRLLHCTVKSVDNALTRAKKKVKKYAGTDNSG